MTLRSIISRFLLGLALAACSCTPVGPVSKAFREATAVGDVDAGTVGTRFEAGGQACSVRGDRSCESGDPSRKPLLCDGGVWRGQAPCQEDQRCDVEPGASYGTCVKISADCIGRLPNKEFCDATAVRACSAGISMLRRRCDEQQTCLEKGDAVVCECSPGAVEIGGVCRVGTSCEIDNGGCDALTDCTMQAERRTCAACPTGYTGLGATGCTPTLIDLGVDAGELTPSLSTRDYAYHLALPIVRQQVRLAPQVAAGVQVEINGSMNDSGAWSSGPLTLGQHAVAITLTANSGLTSRYMIDIERAGAQEAFLTQRGGEQYDSLGWRVAIDGDTLAVGAPGHDGALGGVDADETDNSAAESGAVYVFVRSNGAWSQQALLKAEEPHAGAFFGSSLAIDGDTLVVGAAGGTYYSVTQAIGNPARPGSAFVFVRQGGKWSQQTEIVSPSRQPDKFGWSVALGNQSIVIGAPSDSAAADQAGAVYVVPRNASFSPIMKLPSPQPTAGAVLGFSLAFDGGTLLVGAPHNLPRYAGNGAVFAFNALDWSLAAQLTSNPNMPEASFGFSVALAGDLAAVGASRAPTSYGDTPNSQVPHGDVFVFQRAADRWSQTAALRAPIPRNNDLFGIDLALTDGALLVGASGDSSSGAGFDANMQRSDLPSSGAFYLFARAEQASDWTLTGYAKASMPSEGALFGGAVAVSGDTIVIGAVRDNGATGGSGAVHVFR